MQRGAARRPHVYVESRLQDHLDDFPVTDPGEGRKLRGKFERQITNQPVAVPAGQMQRRVRVDRSPVGRVGRQQLRVALQQQADRLDPCGMKTDMSLWNSRNL